MHPPFTAALLAGGKSTRMGRDKAHLPVEWEGISMHLWKRQLGVLQALAPDRLLISGPHKPGYPKSVAILADEYDGVGPLGGIATCLSKIRTTLLLVLAIDLPQIQPAFLLKLLARSKPGCGVVPVYQNRFEPLMALYPAAALEVALDQLSKQDFVLQHFAEILLKNRLVTRYDVELSEEPQLKNWNTPDGGERRGGGGLGGMIAPQTHREHGV
jgi:molybdopterin-guanine dinucleotide biosynthesis protein A